jgi:Fe-S-cluster containining protein
MNSLYARRPKFSGQKYLAFRCTECGNCCSDTLVPITDLDVRRLMEATGLPAEEIVAFYAPSDFEDKGEGLSFANLDGGRFTLGLQKRRDEENGRDACKFFVNNRCSVYAQRPVTCRVWPFTLAFDATGRRVTRLSINPALPCPYELDGKNSLARLVADWKWDDKQDAHWSAKVSEWNRTHTKGSRRDFLKFLGLL